MLQSIAIMQPYYFPYIGYFKLIHKTDLWVAFDIVQYNSKSWMNRNRVLHPKQGWQYINVPVNKAGHGTSINKIKVVNKQQALSKVLGKINHYKKYAPYFNQVIKVIEKGFNETSSDLLLDLNLSIMSSVCRYLGISFNWKLCSDLKIDNAKIKHAGDWALEISDKLGAKEYFNLPGGVNLFNHEDWRQRNIGLNFIETDLMEYSCKPYVFEENLSIIDVLMWNDPNSLLEYLDEK